MSWIELDDGILNHPKFVRAVARGGSDTIHLWLGIRAYCAQHLTDGFVPDDMLDEARGPKTTKKRDEALRVLVDVGLIERMPDGLQMHDYLQWSKSRAEILEQRRIAGVRTALRTSPDLMDLIKRRDDSKCRYCGVDVDWRDRRGPLGGTYDHVLPLTRGGQNTLENIVVACRSCNARKGAHTPDEAGMRLQVPTGSEPDSNQETLPVTTPLPSGSTPDPNPDQDRPAQGSNGSRNYRTEASYVFEAWKQDVGKHRSKLDDKRATRIIARLKDGFSKEELVQAIAKRRNFPWLMGQGRNSDGTVYDGIETLLRDRAQVEKLLFSEGNDEAMQWPD